MDAGIVDPGNIGASVVSSALASRSAFTILTGRGHVARKGSDPLQPGTHRREALQVVAALRTEARVHIQGDVSDRGTLPNEILVLAQMPLHNPEGPVSLLEELLQLDPSLGRLSTPHMRHRRGLERLSRRLYCSKNIQRKI